MLRRQFTWAVGQGLFGALVCGTTGCGTFMYSERCGMPHSGRLDWKVVALDGLGLLVFFVPGVIAFIVDFSTGAIFLPAAPQYGGSRKSGELQLVRSERRTVDAGAGGPLPVQEVGFKRVEVPREELCLQRIEQVVSDHVQRPVSLGDEPARVSRLDDIAHFDAQVEQHRRDPKFGDAIRAFWERLRAA